MEQKKKYMLSIPKHAKIHLNPSDSIQIIPANFCPIPDVDFNTNAFFLGLGIL